MNYREDIYGKVCLERAVESNSYIGFGAVLVKKGKIISSGRNRRSTVEDRKLLSHIDYAVHAEQDCIINAIKSGFDITNSEIFVLGIVLRGKSKGQLTIRTKKEFGCMKCPHSFIKYNISINIPYIDGWVKLNGQDALNTAKGFINKGNWLNFSNGVVEL